MEKLKAYMKDGINEAGVDEVGRGCLSGPVIAASVILPNDFDYEIVKDSKQLKEHERHEAYRLIKEHAIAYGIGSRSAKVIDEINILNATFESMHSAIQSMENNFNLTVNHLLIDGNRFNPYFNVPHTCVVKGDAKFYSIAAASILAKVTRDEYMKHLSSQYPLYEWASNKGYGSKKHRAAIVEHGPTEQHRMSFLGNILKTPPNSLF